MVFGASGHDVSLVSLGTFVVKHGKRRLVDPHGFGVEFLEDWLELGGLCAAKMHELLTTAS